MIRQVLINTPDASDAEIAEFVHHKGREIKTPRASFMACLSAVVVGAMQGHRIALYRQQRQKQQEQREAEQRRKLEETVECAELLVAKLEQHLAGQRNQCFKPERSHWLPAVPPQTTASNPSAANSEHSATIR
jgi:hypothetical protein